jgi:hypothetical protein
MLTMAFFNGLKANEKLITAYENKSIRKSIDVISRTIKYFFMTLLLKIENK